MTVLLTGGEEFIGSVVRDLLETAANNVFVFDRAADLRDDVTDLNRVRSAVAGCQVVVHLACPVGLRAWGRLFPEPAPFNPCSVHAATRAHGVARGDLESRDRWGRRRLRFQQRLRARHAPGHPVRGRGLALLPRLRTWPGLRGRPAARNLFHVTDVARAVVAAVTADLPAGLRNS